MAFAAFAPVSFGALSLALPLAASFVRRAAAFLAFSLFLLAW